MAGRPFYHLQKNPDHSECGSITDLVRPALRQAVEIPCPQAVNRITLYAAKNRRRFSVMKQAYPRERHSHAVSVTGCDHRVIAH